MPADGPQVLCCPCFLASSRFLDGFSTGKCRESSSSALPKRLEFDGTFPVRAKWKFDVLSFGTSGARKR
jgi:hypothetical protein